MTTTDDTDVAADAAGAAEKPPRSKVKTLMTVGLCAVLAGGGYVLGGMMSGPTEPASPDLNARMYVEGLDGATDAVEIAFEKEWCEGYHEVPVVGEVVDLPPMSVNLADGHYLRVAVSLGLRDDGKKDDKKKDGHDFVMAPAQDIVVSTLSGRTVAELHSPDGRELAKQELTDQVVAHYGEDVIAVYLTEFVMQ